MRKRKPITLADYLKEGRHDNDCLLARYDWLIRNAPSWLPEKSLDELKMHRAEIADRVADFDAKIAKTIER